MVTSWFLGVACGGRQKGKRDLGALRFRCPGRVALGGTVTDRGNEIYLYLQSITVCLAY